MAGVFAFIGFGEAGEAFAGAPGFAAQARAYDRLTERPETRVTQTARYAAARVEGCDTLAEALGGALLVLSVVTADQALAAADSAARAIEAGALYCDMNSVAPETKRAAARAIERMGARYVDCAIMGPVHPARLGVPVLLSGPHGEAACEALGAAGFGSVRVVGTEVGRASAIKMIRSVMIKGIEALTAECLGAAHAAGVADEVLGSLGPDWRATADYNLDRMLVHGVRRSAEMDEVVKTLDALAVPATMARATMQWHRAMGDRAMQPVPQGLDAKLARMAA